jgi:hypothetical protein
VGPDISYYNSGSWCEQPCVFLTIEDGKVEVHHFSDAAGDAASETNEGSYLESPAGYLESA